MSRKSKSSAAVATPPVSARGPAMDAASGSGMSPALTYSLGLLAALYLAFQIYAPALNGQFVFDDLYLTFTQPFASVTPLWAWCGLRPILGLSYWVNYQVSGLDPFTYHAANVFFHCVSSVLMYFIILRILKFAGTVGTLATILSLFSALVFLLHPIQTEAVAYVASRSENLSVLFVFAAFLVFIYRRQVKASWLTAASVLALFLCAVGTKEYAIALPAVLLLTDYFFNPGFRFSGIHGNWRLYAPIGIGAVAAVLFVWSYVSRDAQIGFHVEGIAWYQYLFTQFRAYFAYALLFVFPIGQNVDHDFAVSKTLTDHGAIFALIALLALVGAAIRWRERYPLAAYGFGVFLLFLAPTSSVVPIRDVFVERRLYFPCIGLLIMALEPLRRVRLDRKSLALILFSACALLGYMTWSRAHVWTSSTALWEDSVAKAPNKVRARVGLGNAYFHDHRCAEAVREYEAGYQLAPPDFSLKYNLGAAYECVGRKEEAKMMLQKAIAANPKAASSYALLGLVLAENQEWQAGLSTLKQAEQIDAGYAPTYAYLGIVFSALGRKDLAATEYETCLRLDPKNAVALKGQARLQQAAAR